MLIEKQNLSKEEKEKILEDFKKGKDKGAVLLAVSTGNFGEGIDLPGDFLFSWRDCFSRPDIPRPAVQKDKTPLLFSGLDGGGTSLFHAGTFDPPLSPLEGGYNLGRGPERRGRFSPFLPADPGFFPLDHDHAPRGIGEGTPNRFLSPGSDRASRFPFFPDGRPDPAIYPGRFFRGGKRF